MLSGEGKLRIDTPRDADGSFEPVLIPKHARRFTGFDDKVVTLYAHGLTVREIQGFLAETYGVDASPDFISLVTDGVLAEILAWQSRPLEPVYAVVLFDALWVETRENGVVRNKSVYLALGIRRDGTREILGIWFEANEGAKFWLKVFDELRSRGVLDILGAANAFRHIGSLREPIAVTDGLKDMQEALAAVFPATALQTCIGHTIRTQLLAGVMRTLAARLFGGQWNDMADLQAVFADDDALDDQLQDCLLFGKCRFIEAGAYARAECYQTCPQGFSLGALLV